MPQAALREQNKQLTTEKALTLFIRRGVEQTSIKDIARAAGITERSIYRYFETRSQLILATTFLFWQRISSQVNNLLNSQMDQALTGIQRIRLMLRFYSTLYVEHPEYVRYILNAETALYNAGVTVAIRSRPPGRFEDSDSPLVQAIRLGLADGTVSREVNVKEIYYNAYDAILGAMQRQVLGSTDCDLDGRTRMEHLCELFVRAFEGRI